MTEVIPLELCPKNIIKKICKEITSEDEKVLFVQNLNDHIYNAYIATGLHREILTVYSDVDLKSSRTLLGLNAECIIDIVKNDPCVRGEILKILKYKDGCNS